jgi:hypothetical protein
MRKKYEFTKKDLVLTIILSITILLCNYSLSWHSVYKEHNKNISVLSGYLNEVSSEELHLYIVENPNIFVYFGIVDDEDTKVFEKEFKRTVDKYFLNDKVVYVNVKELDLKTTLSLYDIKNKNIEKSPVIVYFEDGKIYDYINLDNSNMTSKSILRFFKLYGEL